MYRKYITGIQLDECSQTYRIRMYAFIIKIIFLKGNDNQKKGLFNTKFRIVVSSGGDSGDGWDRERPIISNVLIPKLSTKFTAS